VARGRDQSGKFTKGNTYGGQSTGRPKKNYSIPDLLDKIGEEEGTLEGLSKLEVVLRSVYRYALEGKSWAVQFIADRTEGKPHQTLGISDATDEPIKVFDFDEVED
jgi:hypothetical protein